MMRLLLLKDGCYRLEVDADYIGVCKDEVRMTFSGLCKSNAEVERQIMQYNLAVDYINRHGLNKAQEDSDNE